MRKAKYSKMPNYLKKKNKRGKLRWIENKVILTFVNEEPIKEKRSACSTLQNKNKQAISKVEHTNAISCRAQT